jgi:hypothetical protein
VFARNDGKRFIIKPLPVEAQFSPVMSICASDINADGKQDILLGGNLRSVQTELGPYDASLGLALLGDGQGNFKSLPPAQSGFVVKGEIRSIKSIKNSQGEYVYLISRNNEGLMAFKKAVH